MSESPPQPSSLRAQQVAQTRDSLVQAGRKLFGQRSFRETSVEDLARAAQVTTGALYHHFPTKTALFEAVFEHAHTELMTASMKAAQDASDDLDELGRGFEAFLDAVLEPDLQRILVLDGPAVPGRPATPNWTSVMHSLPLLQGFEPRPRRAPCGSTIRRPSPGCCWVR